MVFSFFKKPSEKMVARPAATPKRNLSYESDDLSGGLLGGGVPGTHDSNIAVGVSSELTPIESTTSVTAATPSPKPVPQEEKSFGEDNFAFSDFNLQPMMFDVQAEKPMDPVESDIEQVAVLYANGQDALARSLLESAIHTHSHASVERLWLMLFDLYRLTRQQVLFDALCLEYAQTFEKSPPSWGGSVAPEPKKVSRAASARSGSLLFRGKLTGDNDVAFASLDAALEKDLPVRLDMSKVGELDDLGAQRMLRVLEIAFKKQRSLEILGNDALVALIESRIEMGKRENAGCWLLLLELYQRMGKEALFEDTAINYAVTFEMSPPSWKPARVVGFSSRPVPSSSGNGSSASNEAVMEQDETVFSLKGDLKSERFGGLSAFIKANNPAVIDFSEVSRIDFVSAGTLVNLLTPAKQAGKHVIIRHPNRLAAELLAVVGLGAVADVVFARF